MANPPTKSTVEKLRQQFLEPESQTVGGGNAQRIIGSHVNGHIEYAGNKSASRAPGTDLPDAADYARAG